MSNLRWDRILLPLVFIAAVVLIIIMWTKHMGPDTEPTTAPTEITTPDPATTIHRPTPTPTTSVRPSPVPTMQPPADDVAIGFIHAAFSDRYIKGEPLDWMKIDERLVPFATDHARYELIEYPELQSWDDQPETVDTVDLKTSTKNKDSQLTIASITMNTGRVLTIELHMITTKHGWMVDAMEVPSE